jgi:hypothetical protein
MPQAARSGTHHHDYGHTSFCDRDQDAAGAAPFEGGDGISCRLKMLPSGGGDGDGGTATGAWLHGDSGEAVKPTSGSSTWEDQPPDLNDPAVFEDLLRIEEAFFLEQQVRLFGRRVCETDASAAAPVLPKRTKFAPTSSGPA